jgi:hypothetical protein
MRLLRFLRRVRRFSGLVRRGLRAAAGEHARQRGQQLQHAAAGRALERLGAPDHEARREPGEDDAPRRPQRPP